VLARKQLAIVVSTIGIGLATAATVALAANEAAEGVDARPAAADERDRQQIRNSHRVWRGREFDEGAMKRKARDAAQEKFELSGGVSQATLDAIASCESGGDPTAVNAAGYYGKYQFDTGTWASVGGSGNPADASEAEQDMRASMLYARAGSSPWPVCGQ